MIYLPLLYKLISYNILITFLLGFPQTKYNERQAKLQEATCGAKNFEAKYFAKF